MLNDPNEEIVFNIQWEILSKIKQQYIANGHTEVFLFTKYIIEDKGQPLFLDIYIKYFDYLKVEKVIKELEFMEDRALNEIIIGQTRGISMHVQFQVDKTKFDKLYKKLQKRRLQTLGNTDEKEFIIKGNFRFNTKTRTFIYKGVSYKIPAKRQETKLFLALFDSSPNPVSKTQLRVLLNLGEANAAQRIEEIKSSLIHKFLPDMFGKYSEEIASKIETIRNEGYKLITS